VLQKKTSVLLSFQCALGLSTISRGRLLYNVSSLLLQGCGIDSWSLQPYRQMRPEMEKIPSTPGQRLPVHVRTSQEYGGRKELDRARVATRQGREEWRGRKAEVRQQRTRIIGQVSTAR